MTRDMTPAVGTPASPDWAAPPAGADVRGAAPAFADPRMLSVYGDDTAYAATQPLPGQVAGAARRARDGAGPDRVDGPFIHGPVWSWAVPAYFWIGGMASGASFIAVACDVAGEHGAAVVARRVAVGVVTLAPPLLIGDLGRRARFLNVLRVFKPRSPMNLGSWALSAFSVTAAAGAGADVLGWQRSGRALGVATAASGMYLGSYTGVLLASTAVPVWSRSRGVLGPLFVTTATATGAAATRLAFAAAGIEPARPARRGVGLLESGAMVVEIAATRIHDRRLGPAGASLRAGRAGRLFAAAQAAATAGLLLRLVRRQPGDPVHHAASALYLAAGLLIRLGWLQAGRQSAADDAEVARTARDSTAARDARARAASEHHQALPGWVVAPGRAYAASVRRVSLAVERLLHA